MCGEFYESIRDITEMIRMDTERLRSIALKESNIRYELGEMIVCSELYARSGARIGTDRYPATCLSIDLMLVRHRRITDDTYSTTEIEHTDLIHHSRHMRSHISEEH
jgi:hypothetical protein